MVDTGNKQERDQQIAASLLKAGIGVAYHKRRLGDLGKEGEILQDWLKETGIIDTHAGRSWNVIGATSKTYDTMMILARALHVSGSGVRVVSLRRLIAQVVHTGDLLEELDSCSSLFVVDFFQKYPSITEAAVSGREVQEVEDFLNERLNNLRAVCVHSAVPLASATWWSAPFLQRLQTLNRSIEVSK